MDTDTLHTLTAPAAESGAPSSPDGEGKLGRSKLVAMPVLKYSEEFKEVIVAEVIQKSRPIAEVAESYGLVPQTVSNWVGKWRRQHPAPVMKDTGLDQAAEIKQLRAELREARLENEFLKKAAAFFAKTSQ